MSGAEGVAVSGQTMRAAVCHEPRRVAPHIDAVYPLGEVAGALRKVADRRSTGKVLVVPTR